MAPYNDAFFVLFAWCWFFSLAMYGWFQKLKIDNIHFANPDFKRTAYFIEQQSL